MSRAEIIGDALDRPELARLLDRIRGRLESNGLEVAGWVSLPGASRSEKVAVARLLGAPPSVASSPRVSLARLDEALRSSRLEAGLLEVVEVLTGPLRDRRSERAERSRRREELWASATAHPAVQLHAGLEGWFERLRSSGLLARAATASDEWELLSIALGALARLPADGVRLPVIAAELTGDAHALDRNRPLGMLVTNALAHLAGVEHPATAEARRALWARFGVACDDLSCDVLGFGLRPRGGPVAASIAALADAGEPVRVTLRQLLREPWEFGGEDVFVCENPVVVAEAAERLGAACPPLVCTEGVPTTAAAAVLQKLARAGGRLSYHGDFDWAGVRIAARLGHTLPVVPWRYRAEDYERASARGTRVALGGSPVDTPWDPALRTAMEAAAVAVFEEQVIEDLMADLERRATKPRRRAGAR